MGVVPEESDRIYSPSSGLMGARELTPAGSLSQDPSPGVWARVGGRWGRDEWAARGSVHGFNLLGFRQGRPLWQGLALWAPACFLEKGERSEARGGPPAQSLQLVERRYPPCLLLLVLASLVLGVQLTLSQFGEADADGGQGLHVVRLHDVAQEPPPKAGGV